MKKKLTGSQWREIIQGLDKDKQEHYLACLEDLWEWDIWRQELNWIPLVHVLLRNEIENIRD